MIRRKLKRQLSLPQVVMLGTAGAIGAEIFVLTGHAAGIAGPAFVLALLLGIVYYLSPVANRIYQSRIKSIEKSKDRIIVPIANPKTGERLVYLAAVLAQAMEDTSICVIHMYSNASETEEIEDKMITLRQIVTEELGLIPARLSLRVQLSGSITTGILTETKRQVYDLLVMGASEEWGSGTRLFGSVDDWIVENIENCSVLLARHYEPAAIHWFRLHLKMISNSKM